MIVTPPKISVSGFNRAGWRPRAPVNCDDPIVTRAPACGEVPHEGEAEAEMCEPTSCEPCSPFKALTGKQRLALALRKGGMKDEEIADRLGIARENANRLVNRALRAEDSFRKAVADFIGSS